MNKYDPIPLARVVRQPPLAIVPKGVAGEEVGTASETAMAW